MIPEVFIIVSFLTAFGILLWQYFQIDPRRRILNLRFLLMVAAIVATFYYIVHAQVEPDDRHTSWMFQALGLLWIAWGWWLLRRMPPREHY